MDIYNRQVHLPDNVLNLVPTGVFRLKYSRHATDECYRDKKPIPMFRTITVDKNRVVEVYVESGNLVKFVFRMSFSKDYDVVFVLAKSNNNLFVITNWLNRVNDYHCTLHTSRLAGAN